MCKLVITDEDKLQSWETLINAVDKSDIPIKFVNSVIIEFKEPVDGEQSVDMNIVKLRDYMQEHQIEQWLQEIMDEHDDNIKAIHFYLNIQHVAKVVQGQTDILLGGTK